MRIKLLPPLLANQIAAGEVIERPASVVKELLENSIDAGSTAIEIELVKGGAQLIRISDNGHGIHKDDLPLALARHATSKINSIYDLEQLMSLGFRGEALASIASVSRLKLVSCQENQSAWAIETEGTLSTPKLVSAAHARGTTVEIYDLFFNVPARRKFLKSEKTEYLHIEALIKCIALVHCNLRIKLTHNQRNSLLLAKVDDEVGKEQRLTKLLGKAFVKNAIHIDIESTDLRLRGWIALPEYHRTQNDEQFFYVNSRPVKDKIVTHAIRQIYNELLPANRHPAFVLDLLINPQDVDVNVHPTKNEVRFRESRMIHNFITYAISRALNEYLQTRVSQAIENFSPQDYEKKASTLLRNENVIISEANNLYKPVTQSQDESKHEFGKIIGVFNKHYLLCETEQGLLIIDLLEATQQLLVEEINLLYQENKIISLPLLIPEQLSLNAVEMQTLENYQPLLQSLGFIMEALTPDIVLLRQAPSYLKEIVLSNLAKALIDLLIKTENQTIQTVIIAIAKLYSEQKINNFDPAAIVQLLKNLNEKLFLFKNKKFFWQITLEEINKQLR